MTHAIEEACQKYRLHNIKEIRQKISKMETEGRQIKSFVWDETKKHWVILFSDKSEVYVKLIAKIKK